MKLKLETQDAIVLLVVTESVSAQDAAILKAGVSKIFHSGKKKIVADLTGARVGGREALQAILELKSAIPDPEFLLVIASPQPTLGDAPDREKAILLAKSALATLLASETRLKALVSKLEKDRDHALRGIAQTAMADDKFRKLRNETAQLRKLIKELEAQVLHLYRSRKLPEDGRLPDPARLEQVRKTLSAVLEKDGVLPAL